MSKFKPLTLRHILILRRGEMEICKYFIPFRNRHMVHNDDDEKLQENFAHENLFLARLKNHLSS
jgi:hypothetical protein